jgi:uncharacterized protein YndB with AHSA1/START domain
MAEKTGSAAGAAMPEVFFTRTFDAPRDLVWDVWTDPKHVAQCWGPTGFTSPVCELDPRPGGAILIHMRAPDGREYPMTGAYQEIVKPERIVFTSSALNEQGHPLFEALTVVTFAERAGKTTITVHQRIVKATPQAAPHIGGMELGWKLTLDRLEAHVAEAAQGEKS